MRPDTKEFVVSEIERIFDGAVPGTTDFIGDVWVVGSITGFQYGEDADIDVNVCVDMEGLAARTGFDEEDLRHALVRNILAEQGQLLPGTAHPVNPYLNVGHEPPPADGIYDLAADKWIKIPERGDPSWDPYEKMGEALDRAERLAEKIDAKWGLANRAFEAMKTFEGTAHEHQIRFMRAMKSLKRILQTVMDERHAAFDRIVRDDPEGPVNLTPENIVYKALEHWGELDRLHRASAYLHDYEKTGQLPESI
jgi:hypothetical protein